MIIILILVVIAIIINLLLDEMDEKQVAALVSGIIIALVLIIAWSVSYGSYVSARNNYDAVIPQYRQTIDLYSDKVNIDVKNGTITDFKYQAYQETIAKLIKDLRWEIKDYNSIVTKKRILKRNPMFSWLIIAPDPDMKILSMNEEK